MQTEIKQTAKRFNVLDCGRRFGKDILGQDLIIDAALDGPAAWFAPTYRMMIDNWREISALLLPVTARANAADHRLELITGGYIDFWSLDNPDSARGRKYMRVFINEAAMVRELEYAWTHVIRATLADYQGDAWFASTPKGLNYFHSLWQRGQDNVKDWRSWRFPTSANPYIKHSEIDAMRAEMPARVYSQEIEAAFVEDGTYFRNVNACAVIDEPDKPEDHTGHKIVAGVDWGKKDDFTVVTAFCCQCHRVVDWDRTNIIGYDFQRARLKVMHDRWHFTGMLPERNSIGEPNIEVLRNEGMPIILGMDGQYGFNTTATSKPLLIEGLALAIERREIQIPREYAIEMMAYEIEMSKSGKPTWSAPTGQHDDKVISLALAYYAASHATAQVWI